MSFDIFCCYQYQYLICGCVTFFFGANSYLFLRIQIFFQSRKFFVSLNFIVINVQTLKIFYNFVVVYTTFFWNCINAPILLTFKVLQNSVLYTLNRRYMIQSRAQRYLQPPIKRYVEIWIYFSNRISYLNVCFYLLLSRAFMTSSIGLICVI